MTDPEVTHKLEIVKFPDGKYHCKYWNTSIEEEPCKSCQSRTKYRKPNNDDLS